ncbi:hypothetical protein KAR91_18615 [Candidatus Pacearchaeota archaeon]|nr:hypothetical protein [Candidatus Pacearchaeota archaeon]
MSLLGSLNRKVYILERTLTEADSFPYDLNNQSIIGISISNNTSTNITIVVTDIEDNAINVNVSANTNFEGTTKELKTINTSAITSFDIALFEEG